MAKFHFIEDYERLVRRLMWKYSLDEAMSRAVGGGGYEQIGQIEAAIVGYAGLRDGQSLVDLGCGSGRLASALGQQMSIEYCGIDVVKALLKYAKKKSPENYRFILNRSLRVPLPDASADMATAFSVFTHLLHHESYIYLEELRRVVRPGGMVVFSFLEFSEPSHWSQFEATVEVQRSATLPHLNQFLERSQIEWWSDKLGYEGVRFVDSSAAPWGTSGALGQSIAILQR
ncbi:MAG TPA: methyltransferase domain-containing protein [Rhodanobacter sp.]